MNINRNRKWCITFLTEVIVLLLLIGSITIIVDPFFHYHKPLSFLQYPINNQRYQNDGILRNFDYDSIIVGTSMTENFKTSEFDRLFNTKAVKVPYAGATFKETNDSINTAINNNKQIKYVLRGIDYQFLFNDKDSIKQDISTYPTYLYDNNIFNDVKYVLNKEVLFNNIIYNIEYTLNGSKTTSFDDYCNWSSAFEYGQSPVSIRYTRLDDVSENIGLSETEKINLIASIEQNLSQVVKDNPNIEFYYFYTPYSIYYWDYLSRNGELKKQIEAENITTEILLQYSNVQVFSFLENIDMISNLDNYKDFQHYGEWINSDILGYIKNKKYLLTKENYRAHYEKVLNTYLNYNYDQYFN